MKIALLLGAVFLTISLSAQKMYEEKPSICPLQFMLEDKEQYITYEPNDSILVLDFFKDVEEKYMKKLMGVFLFQVMIDTAFNTCCVSYTNKSNMPARKFDLPASLQNMEGWKRNAPGLENENICALVNIYIDKYEYKVQRIGYSRNTGKQLLESNVYKRYVDTLPVITP